VELLIACHCIHYIHLTSIRFNSGDLVGRRNTNYPWMMFDHRLFYFVVGFVYRYIIQYQKYLFYIGVIFLVHPFYKIKVLFSFCMNVSTSDYWYGHKHQTRLECLLSFEPWIPLTVQRTMKFHRMFLLLPAPSHLRRAERSQKVTCILVLQFAFFK
jgi:hypothetical protein